MSKELVIVESPAKARTIGRILGNNYSVKSSLGHVRDLPQKSLGIDVLNGCTPKYIIPEGKKKVVEEIKKAAVKASAIYLATDPDREGEAISWHLLEAIGVNNIATHRVVFHEITEEAIKAAFHHPRKIDMNLVDAQQARRVLDRLVGYKISPLLWQKIQRGLSAGRVQSVALRMIVEREREIQAFVSQEYWSIDAELSKDSPEGPGFKAKVNGYREKGRKLELTNQGEADHIVNQLRKATYSVSKVTAKQAARHPTPPFITSTLQQEAWRKLHFTAQHTMSMAQQLYEGLEIEGEGMVGLITYMRTDSTKVASSAIEETRTYISEKYGADFIPAKHRVFTKKAKGAQEAHEAIRPTKVEREPGLIKSFLTTDQLKLYELIWKRMVASQMSDALFDTTSIDIEAKDPREKTVYILRASGSVPRFIGFLTLYSEGKDEAESDDESKKLPQLTKGDALRLQELFPEQHFTQPPPRYNEATLVKTLEEKGIGRPSTYAPIISTIRKRGYVERKDGRFYPLDLGNVVNDVLVEHFPRIVDIGFTAQMEEQLDEISRGEQNWVGVIQEFYPPFEESIKKASIAMVRIKEADQPTEEVCPNCSKAMVIRAGRFGKFLACSGYPKCKTTRNLEEKAKDTKKAEDPTESEVIDDPDV